MPRIVLNRPDGTRLTRQPHAEATLRARAPFARHSRPATKWEDGRLERARRRSAALPLLFFQGVGERVVVAERGALGDRGVPGVGPAAAAGGREEGRPEPGVDGVLLLTVAVC